MLCHKLATTQILELTTSIHTDLLDSKSFLENSTCSVKFSIYLFFLYILLYYFQFEIAAHDLIMFTLLVCFLFFVLQVFLWSSSQCRKKTFSLSASRWISSLKILNSWFLTKSLKNSSQVLDIKIFRNF